MKLLGGYYGAIMRICCVLHHIREVKRTSAPVLCRQNARLAGGRAVRREVPIVTYSADCGINILLLLVIIVVVVVLPTG